jgi:hypothetical protein
LVQVSLKTKAQDIEKRAENRLLSVDEVADYLKIPKSTLNKMCLECEIPCAKIDTLEIRQEIN